MISGVHKPAEPTYAPQAAIKSLGSIAGKIVIDCMNPLGMESRRLVSGTADHSYAT